MAKMGWLSWLYERWGTVLLPDGVWRELAEIGDTDALAVLETARTDGWLKVQSVATQGRPEFLGLHAGEVEAISMALDLRANWLIVDDGDARRVALNMGLRICGLIGMIVWAKQHGKVVKVMDAIEDLRRVTKFRISEAVLGRISTDLGETR